MHLSRREFLSAATAAATTLTITRARGAGRLPLAFSTLGCPQWTWRQILDTATREGFAAIELRGLQGEMDLPSRPEFAPGNIATILSDLRAADLKIACVSSSATMNIAEPDKRAKQLDDGRRFIDLAHQLGAPYVRVFGNEYLPGEPKATGIGRVIDGMRTLAEHGRGSGVTIIVESHGDFTDSATLADILEKTGAGTGLLWDTHHTVVSAKEAPGDTFARVGRFVKHTHIKDSVPAGADRKYVLTGNGDVPVREIVKTLVSGGYAGYYCFEWEKVWHPDIDDPSVAIPHYARTMRQYLEAAGASH